MGEPVLTISDLCVTFDTPDGQVEAVKNVNLSIDKGECLGIVGESGSGKSQTFLAAFGLSSENALVSGAVKVEGEDILAAKRTELDRVRGKRVAFVFQDPLTALTPHMSVGAQMREVLAHHFDVHGAEARKRCTAWLERVRIPEANRRMAQFPHELSGGMRQRVMIAMAMMCEPALLVADEPTTALDVTIQAQIMDQLRELKARVRMAIILITHNFGIISGIADRVAVMFRGKIVEYGETHAVLANPQHPYTKALIQCIPQLGAKRERLTTIDHAALEALV